MQMLSRRRITVDPADLVQAVERLSAEGARFITSVGTDRRPQGGGFEVLHLFALDARATVVEVAVALPEEAPLLPSITAAVPGAVWAERELYDLLGIRSEGLSDTRRLTLADDWPSDVFPLRKDVPHNYRPPRALGGGPQLAPPPPGSTVVPIGPFFPTLEEPAYFRLFVEGERVVGCDYRGFYNHRGIEKLAETLHYDQIPYLAERICGICGFVHSTTFCHALEQAAGIEEPPRARYIRTILLELERIHSHLLWLGLAAHIIGFDTAFMQAWRVREPVMWAAEALTGNRKTYGMNCIGGVRRDITSAGARSLRETLQQVEQEARPIALSLAGDTTLRLRLESVGVLTQAEATRMAVIGPAARASGVAIDVRADFPYLAYPALGDFRPVVQAAGDIQARLAVRMTELFQSIALIRAALDGMPDGPLVAPTVTIPPGRTGIALTEAPRGQCCHYVETGEDGKPYRWRVLAPTWMQLQAVSSLLGPETTVADFPIIAGSLDPCFSCTERLEVVRTGRCGR